MSRHHYLQLRKLLLWLLVAFLGGVAVAQTQVQKKPEVPKPIPGEPYRATMSTQRSFYDPPNQDKVKIEVTGDETAPATNGIMVTGAKIKNYTVTGALQLVAETTACFIDTSVSPLQLGSTNMLKAHSGDGNFYVEGVGFLWQSATSELALSNNVHTIIKNFGLASTPSNKTASTASQIDLYSSSAVFDTKNSLVIYRDHVRVDSPQLKLTSAILTASMTPGEASRQINRIVAETNVDINFTDENGRTIHATGDKAVFARTTEPATNEVLTLTGNPRLETSNGWATADVFVLDQTTGKIQGSANCHFHSASALVTADNPATSAKTNSQTEISSDNFDYDRNTGFAIFRGNVRVDNPQANLVCDTLTAKLSAGGTKASGVDNVVAEHGVVINYSDERGEKTHATAEKAVFASTVANGATNKILDLTGNPVLERTNGWIMADLITVDQTARMIRAEGNHHTIFKKGPGQGGKTAPPSGADAEIFSDFFAFSQQTGVAFYSGNVRAVDPQIRVQAQQATVKLPEGTNASGATRPERIVAETNVIVDYFTKTGEKCHATGDKLVFTHTVTNGTTNEVLELTGNPIIDMTNLKGRMGGDAIHATGDKLVYTSTSDKAQPSELVTLSGRPRAKMTAGVMTADDVIIYDCLTGITRMSKHSHIVYSLDHLNTKPRPKTNGPPALSSVPPP